MLIGRGGTIDTPASSSPVAYESDMAQYATGQGPCLDAIHDRATIVRGDLETEERWPDYRARVLELGVRSMISFQLFVTTDSMGALDLYSRRPHAFDPLLSRTSSSALAHGRLSWALGLSRRAARTWDRARICGSNVARSGSRSAFGWVLAELAVVVGEVLVDGFDLALRQVHAAAAALDDVHRARDPGPDDLELAVDQLVVGELVGGLAVGWVMVAGGAVVPGVGVGDRLPATVFDDRVELVGAIPTSSPARAGRWGSSVDEERSRCLPPVDTGSVPRLQPAARRRCCRSTVPWVRGTRDLSDREVGSTSHGHAPDPGPAGGPVAIQPAPAPDARLLAVLQPCATAGDDPSRLERHMDACVAAAIRLGLTAGTALAAQAAVLERFSQDLARADQELVRNLSQRFVLA
jgi:hypothetical protein